MERNLKQRYAIKFCNKLGKLANETKDSLTQAYKEDTISRSSIFEWYKLLREGRELVEMTNVPGDHQPCELLNYDRRLGIKLIREELNLSYGTVQRVIIEDLSMRKVRDKIVPKVRMDCEGSPGQIRRFHFATTPYSSDVCTPDFFLFPRIKRQLKGNRFDSVEVVQAATTRALNSIPEDDFQMAFET